MISDDRLEELIAVYGFLVQKTLPLDGGDVEINREYMNVLASLKELQSLQKREDNYALLLKSANSDVKRFSKYSDKLAEQNKELRKELAEFKVYKEMMTDLESELLEADELNKALLEDGERLADIVRTTKHLFKSNSSGSVLARLLNEHKALMERIEKEI